MKGSVWYRDEFGAVGFVDRLLDELAYFEDHGRFPGPIRQRLFLGSAEATRHMLLRRYIATIELWSTRLQRDRKRCSECNRPPRKGGGLAPMMHDRVWSKIARANEYLCDACVRRRLGRPICMHDLVVCLWNVQTWRWLDGPRWRYRPAVNFGRMPPEMFDLPKEDQIRLVKLIQGISMVFDVPVAYGIEIMFASQHGLAKLMEGA